MSSQAGLSFSGGVGNGTEGKAELQVHDVQVSRSPSFIRPMAAWLCIDMHDTRSQCMQAHANASHSAVVPELNSCLRCMHAFVHECTAGLHIERLCLNLDAISETCTATCRPSSLPLPHQARAKALQDQMGSLDRQDASFTAQHEEARREHNRKRQEAVQQVRLPACAQHAAAGTSIACPHMAHMQLARAMAASISPSLSFSATRFAGVFASSHCAGERAASCKT